MTRSTRSPQRARAATEATQFAGGDRQTGKGTGKGLGRRYDVAVLMACSIWRIVARTSSKAGGGPKIMPAMA